MVPFHMLGMVSYVCYSNFFRNIFDFKHAVTLTITSAIWIQSTNVTDRQTDRQTWATAKTALTHISKKIKIGLVVLIQCRL